MNVTFLIYLLLFSPLLLFFLWVTKERVLKDEPIFVDLFIVSAWEFVKHRK